MTPIIIQAIVGSIWKNKINPFRKVYPTITSLLASSYADNGKIIAFFVMAGTGVLGVVELVFGVTGAV
jgi:hypothetical protein